MAKATGGQRVFQPVTLTLETEAEVEAVLLMTRPTVTRFAGDGGPLDTNGTGLALTATTRERKLAAHEVYAALHGLVENTNGRAGRDV